MNTYRATAPFSVSTGSVRLDEAQAKRRLRTGCVKATGKNGVFDVVAPMHMKAGEEFGWDGHVPKGAEGLEKIAAKKA